MAVTVVTIQLVVDVVRSCLLFFYTVISTIIVVEQQAGHATSFWSGLRIKTVQRSIKDEAGLLVG